MSVLKRPEATCMITDPFGADSGSSSFLGGKEGLEYSELI